MEVKDGPKMWYPGHANPKIRMATELCMDDAVRRTRERKQPELTTGQYNAVYEAVEKIVATIVEEER